MTESEQSGTTVTDLTAVLVCRTCLMAPGVPCVTLSGKRAERTHTPRLATVEVADGQADLADPDDAA